MYYKLFNKLLFAFALLLIHGVVLAQKEIQGFRVWSSPDSTRIVLDLSGSVDYSVFTLDNPERVVIDIKDAALKTKIDQSQIRGTQIKAIRHSLQAPKGVRVVLDMQSGVKPSAFLLTPSEEYGERLVIDLAEKGSKSHAHHKDQSHSKHGKRDFIVAIDPGHGGEDSGAVGRHRAIKEKDIVLSVAKKLQTLINTQSGMRSFLVRQGDYYVPLRKRMVIAREQGADLFISLHADSFMDSRASGASVFVLSEKGASNEAARWLAEKENRADLVGGVKLENKGDLLASVLLDLSQTASQSASHEFANTLINNLGKVTKMHHKTVQKAGFMVLKSPDIPSVLVELGFISNPEGEANLATTHHQHDLAKALLSGVKSYASKRPSLSPPLDMAMAKKK
jgi:N-acetylmuramoyl-L-alanine amidase